MPVAEQLARFTTGEGFIAALDQSGGSTPKALRMYGIPDDRYSTDAEMFDLINAARARIVVSPAFDSARVLGAILFQGTLDRLVDGTEFAHYLWSTKGIVPLLKIDKGLQDPKHGVQLMKDIPDLARTLDDARARGVFGTKERSVIHEADAEGIRRVVAQQFEVAAEVLAADLVPILEPEVSIDAPDKRDAEVMLKDELVKGLEGIGDAQVAIKVTIPTDDGFYSDLISHPRVARVVALSGGYTRDDACARLKRNPGLIASFSRALLDGLTDQQDDAEFDRALGDSIEIIYRASIV
ncbi:fructose bisphosphate aldolase [Gordonia sp. L191]|uniref:fructose bisphosphate aldolase n=1 Tax=Gordonia sp. L191 TaxID=2982699 RepID=UPI0024BF4546|nr:fructose bisphosphate aldolase [Gordonia sp. L191]WHU49355.1 fructose bisphosphate aldolase [Gordonia sp. L191]